MDGVFMKLRNKILLSVLVGLFATLLHAAPMWWGVLFSPITEPLTTAECSETAEDGVYWEADGTVLRFKSIDLLFSFLHLS